MVQDDAPGSPRRCQEVPGAAWEPLASYHCIAVVDKEEALGVKKCKMMSQGMQNDENQLVLLIKGRGE
jgi:hypothetical protein